MNIPKQLLLMLLPILLSACGGKPAKTYSDDERSRTDSIVAAMPDTSSLQQAARRFAQTGNTYGEIAAWRELGKRYREASRFGEAIDTHKKGLQCAVLACDTLQIVQALNNIGTNFRRMGILDEASSYHYQALAYCDACSDRTSRAMRKSRVVSLNGIGNIHLTLDNREAADSVLRMALAGERALGSALGQAINCANIGAICEAEGQADSAWHYYRMSMQLNRQAKSALGISLCHTHFGRLYENEGRLDSAAHEYREAYDLMTGGSDTWHWLEACLALARVYTQKGDLPTASVYIARAKSTAAGMHSLEHLAEAYRLEYLMYSKRGDYRSALRCFVRSREYADSVHSDRNISHTQNMRIRYERDNKQNEINLMQKNYQSELAVRRITLAAFAVALVLALVVIAFLWYAVRMRVRKQLMMKQAEQMRTGFFTNITHEFRTPLTVIQSAAQEIVRQSAEGSDTHRCATDIIRHGHSLLALINQMLDIAKMAAAKPQTAQWRHGDIVEFVAVLCESHRTLAANRGISLEFAPQQEHVDMDFCPDYVLKTVQNLISNAIKFSNPGSRVLVSAGMCGGAVQISVSDEGIGMTEQQKANIFKPFYQASNGVGGIGTGIGLAVAKLAVENMDGRIDVHSEPGKGSEFVVTLPIRHNTCAAQTTADATLPDDVLQPIEAAQYATPDMPLMPDAEQPIPPDDADDADGVRILIVEDTPDVARYMSRQLNADYAYYFAANGDEAMQKARQLVPDLIITDVMMPGMDGMELCRRIRTSELLGHIPVVMVTAKATHADRMRGLEAGADAYIEKPFHADELNVRVEKLMEQRRLLRQKYSQAMSGSVPAVADTVPNDTDGIQTTAEGVQTAAEALLTDASRAFVQKVEAAIRDMMKSGKTDYDALAYSLCLSRAQLNRKIKAVTGYTTTEFILQTRMAEAKRMLDTTDWTIGDIAMKCGMDNDSYFCTLFKKATGMTPMQYKNREHK